MEERGLLASADRALKEGRLADAEQVLARALKVDPKDPEATRLYGITLARMGQLPRALAAFESLSQMQPTSEECRNWLSILHRRLGDGDMAVREGLAAVGLNASNGDSHGNLGLAYLALGNGEAAVRSLATAVEIRPDDAQFRHNLGIAFQFAGKDAEAADSFRRAVAISPRALPSLIALGNLTLAHGNPLAAHQCAMQALRLDSNSITAHLLAARALTNLGQGEESERHLRQVVRLDPRHYVAYSMLGFRLQFAGRFEEAESAFRNSLEIQPYQGISYWGLRQGKKATSEERPELARLADLAESPRVPVSERAYLHYSLGKGWAELRDYATAIRHYDEANRCAYESNLAKRPFRPEVYRAAFDETIGLFGRDFIESHRHLGSESAKPIFIVGMMRSGTTLMEQILSNHPEVSPGGELQFWLERAPRVVDPVTATIEPNRASQLADDYQKLLYGIAKSGRVTDKMPANIQVIGLIKILFPNAKIINMNRNPLDTCLSIYFTPYEFPPAFAHIRENIVFAYRRNEEIAKHWRSVLPLGSFLDVEYERLVDDSEATIRSVLEFCGLEWDDCCLRHGDNKREVNTPSVWQARQPIFQSSKNQWKHYVPYLGAFAEWDEE